MRGLNPYALDHRQWSVFACNAGSELRSVKLFMCGFPRHSIQKISYVSSSLILFDFSAPDSLSPVQPYRLLTAFVAGGKNRLAASVTFWQVGAGEFSPPTQCLVFSSVQWSATATTPSLRHDRTDPQNAALPSLPAQVRRGARLHEHPRLPLPSRHGRSHRQRPFAKFFWPRVRRSRNSLTLIAPSNWPEIITSHLRSDLL